MFRESFTETGLIAGVLRNQGEKAVFKETGAGHEGSSDPEWRQRFFFEPEQAKVFRNPSKQRYIRNPSIWVVKPFGADRFRKASGCAARHDARTASEHLASFPVSGPVFLTFRNPGIRRKPRHPQEIPAPAGDNARKRNGARLPLATEPRRQRQLMHHRVHAPVRELIQRNYPQINYMSCSDTK